MEDKRIHIYAGAPLVALLDGSTNRSGRINDAAERYLAIIDDELTRLNFSRAEWCAICDANNGSTMSGMGDPLAWRHCWVNIADSPELDEKWGVNTADLALRLRRLSLAGRAAVAEVVERFWRRPDLPTDDALRQAGVRLAA